MWTVRSTNLDSSSFSSCLFSQPPWPVTRSRWTGAGNTAMALEAAVWSSGTHTDPHWTPACTVWTRTWPPPPTASTRSLSQAPPTIPLTPPHSTSCPAPTQWPVSLKPRLLCLWMCVCCCSFYLFINHDCDILLCHSMHITIPLLWEQLPLANPKHTTSWTSCWSLGNIQIISIRSVSVHDFWIWIELKLEFATFLRSQN